MKNPKVDIIMGVYNCEKYLAESIDSILAQTYKNWRLIICDDSSSDSTYKIAEKYSKKFSNKIILLRNEKNMGLNYTLNKCIDVSDAKYVARQDGDDISEPDRIEKEVAVIEAHPEYSVVSSNAVLFDEGGKWGETSYVEKPSKDDFLINSPFCHAASIMNREKLLSVGKYSVNKKLLRVEDYHLWFKMYAKGYRGYNIQECLYRIRDDRDAEKRRTWRNRKNEFYVRRIGYRMLGFSFIKRLYAFRPILVWFLPKRLYTRLHRKKFEDNDFKCVPKTINYCWFGKNPLPESAKKCIASWKKYMPDYKIVEWNEKNFDFTQNKYTKEALEQKQYAFVSDYARLKILYDNGGIYFDIDVELIKPIPEELLKTGFIGKEDRRYMNTGLGFACKKSDPTIKRMLDDYNNIPFVRSDGSFDTTACPIRNTKSVSKMKNISLKILPPRYLNPLSYRTGILKLHKDTISIHYGEATWLDDDKRERMKRKHTFIKKNGRIIGTARYILSRLLEKMSHKN